MTIAHTKYDVLQQVGKVFPKLSKKWANSKFDLGKVVYVYFQSSGGGKTKKKKVEENKVNGRGKRKE
jgi:hypothetical protein